MKRQTIFTAIFLLLVSLLQAQSVSLSVSGKTIGSKDELQVTYSISGVNDDQQVSPDFAGWNVVGSNSSSQTVIRNNQASSTLNYTFVLMPDRAGTLTVPGVSINVNGKNISCNPTTVKVLSKAHFKNNNDNSSSSGRSPDPFQQMQQMQQQMQQQMNAMFGSSTDDDFPQQQRRQGIVLRPGESLENAVKDNVFIRIIPSKTTCYLGEPISVDYEVYTNVYCGLNPVHIPSFGSFSVTDVSQPNGAYMAQVNGKNYHAQTIRKAQLVALKAGDLLLDSASLSCQLYYTDLSAPGDQKVGTVIVKSRPLTIHVLPLPDKSKPADFSGAVGDFSITATVDKNVLPAQENNALHLQITGTGTLDNVSLPAINWPGNIQSYDSKDSQTIDKSSFPMRVTRSFDVPFIGNVKGTAIIPSVKFTYFDTKKNDYATISTDSMKLAFTAPVASSAMPGNPIVQDEGNEKYLWIVLGVGILVFIYYFVKGRLAKQGKQEKEIVAGPATDKEKTEDAPSQETENTVPVIDKEALLQEKKNKLNEALGELQNETDSHQFFILAKALLIQYLQDKLDDDSADESELLQHLAKKYPNEVDNFNSLIARCNKALYMPVVSAVEHDEVLKRIKLLIHTFIYSVNL